MTAAAALAAPQAQTLGQMLRTATRSQHDEVDAAFGSFDLTTMDGLRRFLLAQARVLPEVERVLAPAELLPAWTGRTCALHQDLMALGQAPPQTLPFTLPAGPAARWGALYVLEGSRLGGAMLRRHLPEGAPSAFFDARHAPGRWQAFLGRLDASGCSPSWRTGALSGAHATFAAFTSAARR
ncbi:biliverdin-producing heme oxygenase [Novosphingobium cyanobacteriorum]|uniref:Biliverdin-producing heme oxygenase n=1 Tax=Novosphingobium cyanobacteriorum TaxID=3024215 RepID=A0ABT6CPV3_9SPHN|nr:biliverdin-producing heme oxygenase [Novosphingobium cyanobacteriorum]MDF8335238.1 biliverdin-producing heme oxygenase [Novosphingobium cyanobacteriorum]